METISWPDFERVQMCAGTVLSVMDLPNARVPAYVLTIDFGPLGLRKSSARITVRYGKEELIGQQVIAVLNFPPKQIGGIMSECLVTGFPDSVGGIVLAQPGQSVPNGSRLC
ncbi:MAG TPA: tRNA-binding protein [Flavobacteriales bacterium]|nr:tRNA-binding protein [Flavobacteriales bacterium]